MAYIQQCHLTVRVEPLVTIWYINDDLLNNKVYKTIGFIAVNYESKFLSLSVSWKSEAGNLYIKYFLNNCD